jgi:DNA invertase Pin-like site-specific DNA recombinase
MENIFELIKFVIIYLRKSRGDEADVLEKHRIRLISYAESKGWKYIIKEEDVISGERLSTRPVMVEILDIIEEKNCIYDGVLVAHYDRLSRGNSKDFGTIIEVFQYADKYIITPDRIYNTNDRNDLTMLGIQGVFAHNELRTIVSRFVDGKKDGTMMGKWTNGKPPYPYEYIKKIELNEKGKEIVTGNVVINKEKLEVYNKIKDLYINKRIGTEEISFILNREKVLSPGGKTWSSNAVLRLLTHEFHLGKVIYGKNEWKKNRDNKSKLTKKRNESEWIIGEGKHIPVKTIEEHNEIMKLLKHNTKIPKKSRAGVFPTSGILYCKKCDHRMIYSIKPIEKKTGKQYYFTKCYYKTPTGEPFSVFPPLLSEIGPLCR